MGRKKGARKRRNVTKRRCQRWHARQQARDRYGLHLTTDDLEDISWCIRMGERVQFVKRQSARITHHLVNWGGCTLPVVYDKSRHTVVTFLPPSVLPEYREMAREVW